MKKVVSILALLLGCCQMTFSQTVAIGKQVWMTKNLDVSTFRNGDPIPFAANAEEWAKANKNKKPAWCFYENSSSHGTTYGKLYNWYAVTDARELAPDGWHIPTADEWEILWKQLGGKDLAGKKMKAKEGWDAGKSNSNISGFNALASGVCDESGTFGEKGKMTGWWTNPGSEPTWKEGQEIFIWVSYDMDACETDMVPYGTGLAIRCIKN